MKLSLNISFGEKLGNLKCWFKLSLTTNKKYKNIFMINTAPGVVFISIGWKRFQWGKLRSKKC